MNIFTIASFITNLFSFGSIGDWINEILHKMLLFFDGVAYTLLAYAFKLFQLMCTLNFNSLYGMISGVLTRIEALVMVFVVYKLGISLITFMLNPEEASKKGKEILINIFVTAALLLSYNTIFTLFNELSMLIIGSPDNYNYVVLGEIAEVTGGKDSGLINRLVFGTDEEIPDIGEFISFSICSSFITYTKDPQNTEPLKKVLNDHGKLNFNNLTVIANRIGKDFDMFYIVGFAAAGFMIYSFVKTTIQVGVRAFKLLILQIMAPIAIITVIGEGLKGKTFKNFLNKYISVYIEVFIRMFSMLLICNFVVKFIRNIVDYFPTIDTDEWYTVALMIVLIIIAAFKFAGDIPKFIDEILNTHLSNGKSQNFLRYLGGLVGGGVGMFAGGAVGLVAGARGGGFGGALAGLRSGMAGGLKSGVRGKNVADFFKGQAQVAKDTKATGQEIAAAGGLRQYRKAGIERALGLGDKDDRKISKVDSAVSLLDKYDQDSSLELKQLGRVSTDISAGDLGGATSAEWIKYNNATSKFNASGLGTVKMSSKDEFKQGMLEHNKEYLKAKAQITMLENEPPATTAAGRATQEANLQAAYEQLRVATKESDDAAGDIYEGARAALARDAKSHTHAVAQSYRSAAGRAGVHVSGDSIDIKAQQRAHSEKRNSITDRPRYQRRQINRSK